MGLQGKNILVTGGSLGIGKETARMLIAAGANVAITGRNKERLENQASALGAFPICADVAVASDISRTFQQFIAHFGTIDCLINNAAVGWRTPLTEVSEDDMRKIWEINVLGPTMMAKQAATYFIAQGHGDIVNIASTAALKGYVGGSAYASSKAALKILAECWRAELRPHNVRVCTIYPSEVTTAFGRTDGVEREEQPNRLGPVDIAHAVTAALSMDPRGFIPDLSVFATNPW